MIIIMMAMIYLLQKFEMITMLVLVVFRIIMINQKMFSKFYCNWLVEGWIMNSKAE